ncbi:MULTISPECIES: ABC transporter ATP-binding protein [unclassified Microbacterium]|uniref:ABC transporter ATP-binding protein n=1 Tax=unclassified Microbacterium TaxID=2609290 RepID=UPI0015FF62B5|nr:MULTISPECIES: ABC transporter ATP-binding protein [unclassified Microbacterium]MBT2484137.1 ABC transporter ATP-binding protein [Microbacterium sp. ISL-108]
MSGGDTTLLALENVKRTYSQGGQSVHAVRGITGTIGAGEVVCYLGPNGAGKTTLIKMISTLLTPTAGRILFQGLDVTKHHQHVRSRMSLVLGGDRGFYMRASAVDNLLFFAELQGVQRSQRENRIADALDMVGLSGRRKDRVEQFSRGMRQRLHIARAVVCDPELILLDEPSIGIDAEGARQLRALVRTLSAAGTGVLLTTHYMQEAEELADRVAIVDQGLIAVEGSVHDIASAAGLSGVASFRTPAISADLEASLRRVAGVVEVLTTQTYGGWNVDVAWSRTEPHSAFATELGLEPLGLRQPTLEESYLAFLAKNRQPAREQDTDA